MLENILINPTLSDLVGGIESVTLSDEEARRRRTQKTVLERRSPPTFDILIEIQHRNQLAIHKDVATAVDDLLRGYPSPAEIRIRNEDGSIRVEKAPAQKPTARRPSHGVKGPLRQSTDGRVRPTPQTVRNQTDNIFEQEGIRPTKNNPVRIYPFGVARNRLDSAAKNLGVPAVLARDLGDAQVLVTLRSHYRKRTRMIVDAERRGMPVYVLRSNTVVQMERFLAGLFDLNFDDSQEDNNDGIMRETQKAIDAVLNGERWVEMAPASSYVRRLQHELAQQSRVVSHSYGKEPNRRVRIFSQ